MIVLPWIEIYNFVTLSEIPDRQLLHIGDISSKAPTHENQITIADLTGVAVQDIEVANMVAKGYFNQNKLG